MLGYRRTSGAPCAESARTLPYGESIRNLISPSGHGETRVGTSGLSRDPGREGRGCVAARMGLVAAGGVRPLSRRPEPVHRLFHVLEERSHAGDWGPFARGERCAVRGRSEERRGGKEG